MKAQWLLLISLVVSSATHTKWVEIKEAEKTPEGTNITEIDMFGTHISISNKNTIWALDEKFRPFKWENNKWVIKNKMQDPKETAHFSSIHANLDGTVYASKYERNKISIYEWNGTAWNKVTEFNQGYPVVMDTVGKNNFVILTVLGEGGAIGYTVYQGNGTKWETIGKDDNYRPNVNISIGSDGSLYGIKMTVSNDLANFLVVKWDGKQWNKVETPAAIYFPMQYISVGNKNNLWLVQDFQAINPETTEKISGPFHIYKYSANENKFKQMPNTLETNIFRIYAGKDGLTTWAKKRVGKVYQWVEE